MRRDEPDFLLEALLFDGDRFVELLAFSVLFLATATEALRFPSGLFLLGLFPRRREVACGVPEDLFGEAPVVRPRVVFFGEEEGS